MIDIESKVVDTIFNAVRDANAYPNADVTTGFDEQNATFPCVVNDHSSLMMSDDSKSK